MSDSERDALVELLTIDPVLRRSRFASLRDYSQSPPPSNIVSVLDRLEYVRALGIEPGQVRHIHAARLARLTDEGAIMTVQHIADLEPVRRTAILVAQVANLETRLTDAALAMFEKYVGTLFSDLRKTGICAEPDVPMIWFEDRLPGALSAAGLGAIITAAVPDDVQSVVLHFIDSRISLSLPGWQEE